MHALKTLPNFPADGEVEIVEAGRGTFKAKLAFYSGIIGAFAGIGSFGADIAEILRRPDAELARCVAWTMVEDGVTKAGIRCEGEYEVLREEMPAVTELSALRLQISDQTARDDGPPTSRNASSPAPEQKTAETEDSVRFSRNWLKSMRLDGADLAAIRVEGDSMEPLIRSGDEIFVDRSKRQGEGIFVVRIGDALHVKHVRASAPGTITLVSANDDYPPLELPREEVEVIGRVVWKGGRV